MRQTGVNHGELRDLPWQWAASLGKMLPKELLDGKVSLELLAFQHGMVNLGWPNSATPRTGKYLTGELLAGGEYESAVCRVIGVR